MPTQTFSSNSNPTCLEWQAWRFHTGLTAITGDEGSGKTRLLRQMAGDLPGAVPHGLQGLWLDLSLPDQDAAIPAAFWQTLQQRSPNWNTDLLNELIDALQLRAHIDKQLFMLSAGSRRKVGLAGLLASGAALTCLDQPYAALDRASIQVIREFLHDMADHTTRAWVVADYEADPELPWSSVIHLP